MTFLHRILREYRDPRLYQITVLGALLVYGLLSLDFDVPLDRAVAMVTTAFLTQWAGTRLFKIPRLDFRSAAISSLSLCLLLRTNDLWLAILAAFITIASKFVIRFHGKHIFNPTNLGVVAMLLLTDRVWISSGQWGTAVWTAFFFLCLGGLVVNRAARSDVTWAFLVAFGAVLFGRSLWLGDPMSIPLHRVQNGAFLLFSFFMISDPKTTPDSRIGRILFAILVALGAGYARFKLQEPNALLYSLAFASPLVPLIDCVLRGPLYAWTRAGAPQKETLMRKPIALAVLAAAFATTLAGSASAFCGFYVGRAGSDLYNQASQVVLVRTDNKTVITMANDYRGDPTEFALVVPVPSFIERGQIHVTSMSIIDHLDAYSAPRLVEYFDDDPCRARLEALAMNGAMRASSAVDEREADKLGVTIEATYTVGEYDIVILSAEQSGGLETWLVQNGYQIPKGASQVLESYIKQNVRFFVAKVNLKEQTRLGFATLRPLQVAFESPKFMLPIRLGTVNADGPQDLIVYALTRTGRVETTNYRTVRLPSDMDIPVFVKDEFPDFYRDMFEHQVDREGMRTVFIEYAWDMAWCDPCAADPLPRESLRELGAFWLDGPSDGQAQDVFLTRLHVRYDGKHFPDDLMLQETGDRTNFQGRYVLRHPWTGDGDCEAIRAYRSDLRQRHEQEAKNLASLTGWDLDVIRDRMALDQEPPSDRKWWQKMWGGMIAPWTGLHR